MRTVGINLRGSASIFRTNPFHCQSRLYLVCHVFYFVCHFFSFVVTCHSSQSAGQLFSRGRSAADNAGYTASAKNGMAQNLSHSPHTPESRICLGIPRGPAVMRHSAPENASLYPLQNLSLVANCFLPVTHLVFSRLTLGFIQGVV